LDLEYTVSKDALLDDVNDDKQGGE
jgi:hypothetical protein